MWKYKMNARQFQKNDEKNDLANFILQPYQQNVQKEAKEAEETNNHVKR